MLKLRDTLTRSLVELQPLKPDSVGVYTCGPTVYRDAHIGNLRSYLMTDWIKRALHFHGLTVNHVKNITDVGHMRQEMLEQGDDKVIAAALAEGKTPQEIAQFYTERFLADEQKLNILPADQFPRATDHVTEMVAIVERLVAQEFAYEVEGNVYYSVSKFANYGRLSGNVQEEGLKEAVRVEADPLKRDPRDFTLWKAAEPNRELKWPSPWGEGFPGWHIECSAMSMKYLGEQFDIHTGGVDNIFPHHEGEIAQSEGFTGKPVVKQWVHGQHLLADGVKMAKSAGNSFTLADIEARDIDPLAFRYLCLTARYDTRLNFTFTSLKAAQRALLRLRAAVREWMAVPPSPGGVDDVTQEWMGRLMERVDSNLDMPGALALTWELTHADLPAQARLAVLGQFDQMLGLDLFRVDAGDVLGDELQGVMDRRTGLRQEARAAAQEETKSAAKVVQTNYTEADGLRNELTQAGYVVEDTQNGTRLRPKSAWEKREEVWPTISSSAEAASFVNEPDSFDFSIAVLASNYIDDVARCIQSALRWAGSRSVEVVVVDNGSTDGTGEWLEHTASIDPKIRLIHTDHVLGEGAAKNVVLKQCRGQTVVMLDTSSEVVGDIFGPVQKLLTNEAIGVVGPFGVRTPDLHHFHDDGASEAGVMDAMQAYCFAFRRSLLREVGLMRESFRFYRNLDLDYSFHFKDRGYHIVADPSLPVVRHEHRVWSELSENERDELSKKNYGRFLDKWGERADLLVASQAAPS